MKESEKMEFIADNADLFAGEGGQEMLAAFESGDYNAIEAALRAQMEDRLKTQLAEVQRTLAVEEARVGEDRNEAYIASLREYEKYLLDGNKLYKASLELRLEQEKNQLDKYKESLNAKVKYSNVSKDVQNGKDISFVDTLSKIVHSDDILLEVKDKNGNTGYSYELDRDCYFTGFALCKGTDKEKMPQTIKIDIKRFCINVFMFKADRIDMI